jgi:hypothetical protein
VPLFSVQIVLTLSAQGTTVFSVGTGEKDSSFRAYWDFCLYIYYVPISVVKMILVYAITYVPVSFYALSCIEPLDFGSRLPTSERGALHSRVAVGEHFCLQREWKLCCQREHWHNLRVVLVSHTNYHIYTETTLRVKLLPSCLLRPTCLDPARTPIPKGCPLADLQVPQPRFPAIPKIQVCHWRFRNPTLRKSRRACLTTKTTRSPFPALIH